MCYVISEKATGTNYSVNLYFVMSYRGAEILRDVQRP